MILSDHIPVSSVVPLPWRTRLVANRSVTKERNHVLLQVGNEAEDERKQCIYVLLYPKSMSRKLRRPNTTCKSYVQVASLQTLCSTTTPLLPHHDRPYNYHHLTLQGS
jgi:hypothetical protein